MQEHDLFLHSFFYALFTLAHILSFSHLAFCRISHLAAAALPTLIYNAIFGHLHFYQFPHKGEDIHLTPDGFSTRTHSRQLQHCT